ncbi:hypothetical protein PR048_018443 [Dryococelus australis]|uniref:LIM zinc-binding domain-containing protein n=1 Tax=Dryococelus australis TaxID=614101 RepID=A0ABQ9HCA4_9NEOP|nr:hypothetical protein PR048_018443 [Dryococelus australis]
MRDLSSRSEKPFYQPERDSRWSGEIGPMRVKRAERKTSLGKDWHSACLRCEKCNKTLTPGGHSEHEGKPYCNQPCYAALFGPQGECQLLHIPQGEPGSIPDRVTGFSRAGIVPDDAVGRRVFSGISRFPRRSTFTSIILIGSQDLDVKSSPNLFTHLLAHSRSVSGAAVQRATSTRSEQSAEEERCQLAASFLHSKCIYK